MRLGDFNKNIIKIRKGIVKSLEDAIMDISNMNIGVVGTKDFFVKFSMKFIFYI